MEPEAPAVAAPSEPEEPSGPTVLVVDDDDAIRDMLAFALELEGYRVLHAADGAQALAVVAEEPVDLITLDVMMPLMDGWQVADALRADPRTRALPRVMISGMPVDALMAACASRQAAAIVAKPFELTTVIGIIAHLLDESQYVPAIA